MKFEKITPYLTKIYEWIVFLGKFLKKYGDLFFEKIKSRFPRFGRLFPNAMYFWGIALFLVIVCLYLISGISCDSKKKLAAVNQESVSSLEDTQSTTKKEKSTKKKSIPISPEIKQLQETFFPALSVKIVANLENITFQTERRDYYVSFREMQPFVSQKNNKTVTCWLSEDQRTCIIVDSELEKTTDFSAFANLPHLKSIRFDFSFQKETEETIYKSVGKLTQLKELYIYDLYNDNNIKYLQDLNYLICLEFQLGDVTDFSLELISHFEHLKKLRFWANNISNEGIEVLKNLKELEELEIKCGALNFKTINNQYLRTISFLSNLKKLHISFANISDEGLFHLVRLKNLQELDICSPVPNLTDVGIEVLSYIPSLNKLNFNGWRLSNSGLMKLQDLPNLKSLDIELNVGNDLDFFDITDETLYALKNCKSLEYLSFGQHTKNLITDDGMKALQDLPNLKGIKIPHNKNITQKGFAYLSQMPNIEAMCLFCNNFDNNCIAEIAKMEKLNTLKLSINKENGIDNLKLLKKVKQLVFSTDMTDEDLALIGKMTWLEELDLSGCKNLTEKGFDHLQSLVNLKSIKFPDKISDEYKTKFLKVHPNCFEFDWTKEFRVLYGW